MIHFNRYFICYFFNVIFLPVILYIISELCYHMLVNSFAIVYEKDLLISYIGRSYGGPYFRFYIKRICKFVSMRFFYLLLFLSIRFYYVFQA